ncbi:MAG: hypothetical protein AUI14_15120 [Actinobacteria bacterium 13_2_20CM_2_71_6]|nr:MAG: hypothetical protein AUI14_15120 [Actinobacteria bacterium 13_2_20CM_2_71_6]
MRARTRDRRVYLRSHPVLFALVVLTRRAPTVRLGRTVVVNDAEAYRQVLTRLPLDRHAPGTTGGAARRVTSGGLLFDQEGDEHRQARRELTDDLGAEAVRGLRPVWRALLGRRVLRLGRGGRVDVVALAAELAGATTAALLRLDVDPVALATAACDAAAAAAREHLPGVRLSRRHDPAGVAADRLTALLSTSDGGRDAMLAIAAITTTVAALPRAVAWCADDALWPWVDDDADRAALVGELFRVLAPTPLLPRVAAAPPQLVQLAFGAGPHACPGAALARAQLDDTLAAFAPYRPVVVRARADRRSALPGWSALVVRAGSDVRQVADVSRR